MITKAPLEIIVQDEKFHIPKAEMTSPRVVKLLLIFPPSFNRIPLAPDFEILSLERKYKELISRLALILTSLGYQKSFQNT